MLSQFNVASTATLRFKRKQALVLTDTLTTVHYRGGAMLATMLAVVVILSALASSQQHEVWTATFPHLYTMYLATAIAFAFATSLDVLAYFNAGSEDKVTRQRDTSCFARGMALLVNIHVRECLFNAKRMVS